MMLGFGRKAAVVAASAGPVLDLSGERLRRAFADLVQSAEASGGIERYVTAMALKAPLFEELLGKGRLETLTIGGTLEVQATDPGAVKDFEAFCRTTGNELMEHWMGGSTYVFLIKRTG